MQEQEKKVAPGPDSWLAGGDPTPVVMQQTDTRHGSVLHVKNVPGLRTERHTDGQNFQGESPESRKISQRDEALARANAVRLGRAEIKRAISQREVSAADVILDAPQLAVDMRAYDLVRAVHRVGVGRARKIIKGVCSEHLTLANLGPRGRTELARRVREVEA